MSIKDVALKLVVIFSLFLPALAKAQCFDETSFLDLNYGLYWYGEDGRCEKASPSSGTEFYDPSKPTVLYVHGWQSGNVSINRYATFNVADYSGPAVDVGQIWRDRDWNIGILYWTQLADEPEVKDAEAKIWTTDGPQGLRWLSADGEYYDSGFVNSISYVLAMDIINNMPDFSGSSFRIAGHSLGSQLALNIAAQLHEEDVSSSLRPNRVALLDPFSSISEKEYLQGQWVGEKMRELARNLEGAGVAIESYRSSLVTSTVFAGDENLGLLNDTAFTELRPWYFNAFQVSEKHNAAIWHYFWSFGEPEPGVFWSNASALSASSSDDKIRQYMNSSDKFQQLYGAYTESPEDDVMRRVGK